MKRFIMKISIFSTVWLLSLVPATAHDAWLAAKWNAKKTHIVISPVVAEAFPNGEPIKDMKRFIEPSAFFPDGRTILLSGDSSDSTVLGSVPFSPSFVVTAGVKQREISYKKDIAHEYLTEEAGLTKEHVMKILTPGVEEFTETYSRYLKTIVSVDENTPRDSVIGLPLEIVLLSWKVNPRHQAAIKFRLLDNGKPSMNAPIRVLSDGKSTIVRTDSNGVTQATVAEDQPVLLAHVQITKLSDNRLQSLWTNLAIYRLGE